MPAKKLKSKSVFVCKKHIKCVCFDCFGNETVIEKKEKLICYQLGTVVSTEMSQNIQLRCCMDNRYDSKVFIRKKLFALNISFVSCFN